MPHERRQQLPARWQELFRSFDVLLTTVSRVATIHHDHSGTPDSRMITINGQERPDDLPSTWTGLAGGAYLRAAVAPAGLTRDGLPVGVQVIAPYLEDRTAAGVARQIGNALGGYRQLPVDWPAPGESAARRDDVRDGCRPSRRQVSSPVGAVARLGWTRIGSPGILGTPTPSTRFSLANPQVTRERKSVSYQASLTAQDASLTR